MNHSGNRILEFLPSQEEAVVARVLVLVHQVIDEHFPDVEHAGRQFTKTIFSSDGESTANVQAPGETLATQEKLGTDQDLPINSGSIPVERQPAINTITAATLPSKQAQTESRDPALQTSHPIHTTDRRFVNRSSPASKPEFSRTKKHGLVEDRPDWPMRFMLALMIAGIIVLVYSLID